VPGRELKGDALAVSDVLGRADVDADLEGGLQLRTAIVHDKHVSAQLRTVRLTYAGALPPVVSVCWFARPSAANHGFSSVPGCQR
jgi:hypothetical protein